MAYKKKSTKKEEVAKAAPPIVDMAEEDVKSIDKIDIVAPKPVAAKPQKPLPKDSSMSPAEEAIWRSLN